MCAARIYSGAPSSVTVARFSESVEFGYSRLQAKSNKDALQVEPAGRAYATDLLFGNSLEERFDIEPALTNFVFVRPVAVILVKPVGAIFQFVSELFLVYRKGFT